MDVSVSHTTARKVYNNMDNTSSRTFTVLRQTNACVPLRGDKPRALRYPSPVVLDHTNQGTKSSQLSIHSDGVLE